MLKLKILPDPAILILKVTASLTFALFESTHALILKSPTAPVKSGGGFSGYGNTSILIESD